MKIFFTVSKTGMKKYIPQYTKVLKELKRHKVGVESTIDKSYLNRTPTLKRIVNLSLEEKYKFVHDSAIRKAIYRSDAVVIEASYPSFRLGFETFFTLSLQKPVLVLSLYRDYSNLINQPNFFGKIYNDFTLPDIIDIFLKRVGDHKLRNRFNLFISDNEKRRLEIKSKLYGVSMSDYVRNLINNDNSDRTS